MEERYSSGYRRKEKYEGKNSFNVFQKTRKTGRQHLFLNHSTLEKEKRLHLKIKSPRQYQILTSGVFIVELEWWSFLS